LPRRRDSKLRLLNARLPKLLPLPRRPPMIALLAKSRKPMRPRLKMQLKRH
jgi:hypothetical protein